MPKFHLDVINQILILVDTRLADPAGVGQGGLRIGIMCDGGQIHGLIFSLLNSVIIRKNMPKVTVRCARGEVRGGHCSDKREDECCLDVEHLLTPYILDGRA